MEMISVSVPANARGASVLIGLAGLIGGDAPAGAKVPDDRAGKRGRPKKEAAPADDMDFGVNTSDDEPEADAEDVEDEATEDAEELEADDDEAEDEAPAPKKRGRPAKTAPVERLMKDVKTTKGHTLEGDIIPAFQKFADKHSREKAGKVLAKYGVKSVRDLPKEKYPEILKLLKV